jgi:hypothetical protein
MTDPLSTEEMVELLLDWNKDGPVGALGHEAAERLTALQATIADRATRLLDMADEIVRLQARVEAAERDARRYQFCQHHGFPVRNQTARTEDVRWVACKDKQLFYGATPSFAIDAAIAKGESHE